MPSICNSIEEFFKSIKNNCFIRLVFDFVWFFVQVASGFCLLALFLYMLQIINEKWYTNVTYWANLEKVPQIEKCVISKIPKPFPDENPTENKFQYYEVEIFTNVKNKTGAVLIFPRKEYVDILNSNKKLPYSILWKVKINNLLNEKIKIFTNKEHVSYQDGQMFIGNECPLRVEIILDEKS